MRQLKLLLLFFFISFSAFAQTTEKKVILQGFWWDYENDNYSESWANYLCELAPRLKSMGVDAVWIPPSYKNPGTNSVGYAPFDHYDLGDKYQKGETRTRVGTKDELLRMIAVMHANGIEVIQDVVLNHVIDAGTTAGDGGLDPESTYSTQTAGGFKNFRYVCYDTPVPLVGGENATEYLNRKGRWPKNYTNFHPNANWNVSSGNWESSFWGPDFSYGIDESGSNNGFGPSTNATYNPTQTSNYNRNQARDWIMWFARQTDIDGFRWDAVKHFPHFVVQDLSYNLKYLNGDANLGEGMINFGEYVGGKTELDNYVNDVRYSNGGSEMLAGTFDFGLRGAFTGIIAGQGAYDLSNVPAEQQNERVFYYPASNTYVHRTLPFVNNHDTFRPILTTDGNYNGWNFGSQIGGHIEPNEARLSLLYALTFAVDGTPMFFFEDLFDIGYNGNRFNHDPKNAAQLPVRSDLENIVWCHQNLDFASGPYLVRGHQGNSGDHLIIERGGKAIIGVNDNWNTWQTDWVDSNFPPGTILVDYSGANGNATRTVQNDQRVEISTPPCDGSATNGRRGYSIWAPQGIGTTYTPQRQTSTTQEWEMANDLGDSNCNSLQQGGALPDNSIAYRNVGKIFVNNVNAITYKLIPDDNTKDLTIELFDVNGNSLASQSGTGTLTGNYTANQVGWIDIKIKNTNANQIGQRCKVQITYTAPEVVDVTQYPLLPDVATWTGNVSTAWEDCSNWEQGLLPNENRNAVIAANSTFDPEINNGGSCKDLTIENGKTLAVTGGNFNIYGNLINNGTIAGTGNCGTFVFRGDSPQTISGNTTTICKTRIINNTGTTLQTDLIITEQLSFGSGAKLYTDDYTLEINKDATVLAGAGYVVTKDDPIAGGSVVREVGNTSIVFPIGTETSYTPVFIKSNNGIPYVNVRTFNNVYNNGNMNGIVSDMNQTLEQTWQITTQTPSSDLNLNFRWNASDEGLSFSRNNATIIRNDGGFWFSVPSNNVAGNNPYTQSANGVINTGYFTISNGTVNTKTVLTENKIYSITPNPSNGIFEILSTNSSNEDLQVVIYNAIGEEVQRISGKMDIINEVLGQQKQSKGAYFLRIQSEESKFVTLKIIVH
ncbi:MAG: alpha-amylase family glycosyl hydrolase [Saprospiraceae bacterium]